MAAQLRCAVCEKRGASRCQQCKRPYCSATCQRHDWQNGHKLVCKEHCALRKTFVGGQSTRGSFECPICLGADGHTRVTFMCDHAVCGTCFVKLNLQADDASELGVGFDVKCGLCRAGVTFSPRWAVLSGTRSKDMIIPGGFNRPKAFQTVAGAFSAYLATHVSGRFNDSLSPFNIGRLIDDATMHTRLLRLSDSARMRSIIFDEGEAEGEPRWNAEGAAWCLCEWHLLVSGLFGADDNRELLCKIALSWFYVHSHVVWSVVDVPVRCELMRQTLTLSVPFSCTLGDVADHLETNYRWDYIDSFPRALVVKGRPAIATDTIWQTLKKHQCSSIAHLPFERVPGHCFNEDAVVFDVEFCFEGPATSFFDTRVLGIESNKLEMIRMLTKLLEKRCAGVEVGSRDHWLMHHRRVIVTAKRAGKTVFVWGINGDRSYRFAVPVLQHKPLTEWLRSKTPMKCTVIKREFDGSVAEFEHAAIGYVLFCLTQMHDAEKTEVNVRVFDSLRSEIKKHTQLPLQTVDVGSRLELFTGLMQNWKQKPGTHKKRLEHGDYIAELALHAQIAGNDDSRAHNMIVYHIVCSEGGELCVPVAWVV